MIIVEIYTDGMGTFHARCTGCQWRSPWTRKESRAVDAGKTHVEHEVTS